MCGTTRLSYQKHANRTRDDDWNLEEGEEEKGLTSLATGGGQDFRENVF
jgi:hypothetical protein